MLSRVGGVVVVEELLDRPLVLVVATADAGNRQVLVERPVLLPSGRLDGGDDLAGDAELGEGPERRLAVGPEVADRLVEPDHAFLLDVVGVGADQEVAPRLGARETAVALEQHVQRVAVAPPRPFEKVIVLQVDQGHDVETDGHVCELLDLAAGRWGRGLVRMD